MDDTRPVADHATRAWLGVVALVALAGLGCGLVALLKVNGWDGQLPRIVVAIARPVPAAPLGM